MRAWCVLFLVGCVPRGSGGAVDAGVHGEDAGRQMVTVRRLITLGSSSTAGSGVTLESERYVNLLAAALEAELHNLGTGGQTFTDVQTRGLSQALMWLDGGTPAHQVDLVTFLPLTDFSRSAGAEIAAGYDDVLTQLEAQHAWVVFGLPTIDPDYVCGRGALRGPDGECYTAELADTYDARGAAVREMLADHLATTVAAVYFQEAQHPDWQQPDGHPNALGHRYLAEAFLAEINRRLGRDGGLPPYSCDVPAPGGPW